MSYTFFRTKQLVNQWSWRNCITNPIKCLKFNDQILVSKTVGIHFFELNLHILKERFMISKLQNVFKHP